MYYPYLRGRQNELLALRNFAELLSDESHIFPIIEPVKENINTLKRAVSTLAEHGMCCGVILNPQVGESKRKMIDLDLDEFFALRKGWKASFLLNAQNTDEVVRIIAEKQYSKVLIIISGNEAVDDDGVNELLSSDAVQSVVVDPSRQDIIEAGHQNNKDVIVFEEKFRARPAGKDYLNTDEEEFTQRFAFYAKQGFAGFGDYTVVANEYREGGVLPRVLVMHLTYKKTLQKIYIRHFCSTVNQNDSSNVQGKFDEAANKALDFFKSIGYSGPGIAAIKEYIDKGTFPGLGMLKKVYILHHIDLVQRILSGKL